MLTHFRALRLGGALHAFYGTPCLALSMGHFFSRRFCSDSGLKDKLTFEEFSAFLYGGVVELEIPETEVPEYELLKLKQESDAKPHFHSPEAGGLRGFMSASELDIDGNLSTAKACSIVQKLDHFDFLNSPKDP